jgi:hypothetical protein
LAKFALKLMIISNFVKCIEAELALPKNSHSLSPAVPFAPFQGGRKDILLVFRQAMPETIATQNPREPGTSHIKLVIWLRVWPLAAILAVVAAYTATVTLGHAFIPDDFAAYVMHAANLAEGRPYSDIRYVPNPAAVGFAPARGYPPVYPLILAPIYKFRGVDLRAMKITTVLCFGVSLGAFALLFELMLPPWAISAAILAVGFNIVFWEQRDYLLSEFAYLMFSFCALITAQKIYETLEARTWRIGGALALSLLLYAAYGTRTIGIVLLPALILADICKFRRPSRFVRVVVGLTLGLILVQNWLILSPRSYMDVLHASATATGQHAIFYGKTLSYVWRNGISKVPQIVFALLFTGLAAIGFSRSFWTRRSVVEFYLLGYLAIVIAWPTEIGMRGLLPVLPLYFAYGFAEFVGLSSHFAHSARTALAALLLAFVAVTYLGAFRWSARQERLLDVRDPEAQQLFAWVKEHTSPADLLVFQKPRTLALFTNRETTMLAPDEPISLSSKFLAATNAHFLIQNKSMGYPIQEFIADKELAPIPVFQNAAFQVYLINARP